MNDTVNEKDPLSGPINNWVTKDTRCVLCEKQTPRDQKVEERIGIDPHHCFCKSFTMLQEQHGQGMGNDSPH